MRKHKRIHLLKIENLNKIMIIYIFIYILYPFKNNFKIQIFFNQFQKFIGKFPNLIQIYLISEINSSRALIIEKEWGILFFEFFFFNNIFLLSSNGCPNSNFQCLNYSKKYHDIKLTKNQKFHSNIDRASKRAFSIDNFLLFNRKKWILILTDDTFVNVKKLGDYLNKIENKKGNPFLKSIILGNCIPKGFLNGFLQGGSGYLFSYKAALEFQKFSIDWVNKTIQEDDVHFTKAINRIGLKIKECTSDAFMGHSISNISTELILNDKWDSFPQCNFSKKIFVVCEYFISSLKNIIFLHQSPKAEITANLATKIFDGNYSNNISWFQDGYKVILCNNK